MKISATIILIFISINIYAQKQPLVPFRTTGQYMVKDSALAVGKLLIPAYSSFSITSYADRWGQGFGINTTNGRLNVRGNVATLEFPNMTDHNLKANLASPTFTGTVVLPSTTSIGTITNTELSYVDGVTSAIQTQFTAKAPLASPTFTGNPTLPTGTIATTQSAGNSSTALATTAFVTTADNLKANLSSPTFTGTPTGPTATTGTNTTQLATTAFVNASLATVSIPTLSQVLTSGNLGPSGIPISILDNGFFTKGANDDKSIGTRLQLNDAVSATRALDIQLGNDGDMILSTQRSGTWTPQIRVSNSTGQATFSSDPIVPDEVYGSGWNGSLEPPTKNSVYDKIESMGSGDAQLVGGNAFEGEQTLSGGDYTVVNTETSFNGFRVQGNTYQSTSLENSFSIDNTITSADVVLTPGTIRISSGTGNGSIKADNLTTTRELQMPNKSGTIAITSDSPISSSFSGAGTATTTFTVTIGSTMANNTYKVNATPTNLLSAALFYITNKTTTTFDVVYLTGLTGTVAFDWSVFP